MEDSSADHMKTFSSVWGQVELRPTFDWQALTQNEQEHHGIIIIIIIIIIIFPPRNSLYVILLIEMFYYSYNWIP